MQEGVYEGDGAVVANGNHYTSGLTSAGSSTSSMETAIVTRTVATTVQPSKSKKSKRNSAHLGSDKYLKSCAMDFQYIEVSGNGTGNNGNGYTAVNNTNSHHDNPDTATGNLLAVTEEENVSVTSSSDESSSQLITLAMALENVIIALEEPRGVLLL